MRTPNLDVKYFKKRRDKLSKLAGEDAAFIFFSGAAPCRSNDTHYNFRVDSDFFYLTGFEEENSILIFRPGKTPEAVLFVQPKNPELETWEGFLYGKNLSKEVFKIDETHVFEDFDEKAFEYLKGISKVYFKVGAEPKRDEKVFALLKRVLKSQGRKGSPLQSLHDPSEFLGKLRLNKEEEEIELMRKAGELSAKGHVALMKATSPGVNERALHGAFLSEIYKGGARAEAYGSIVASGGNAATLHYVFNDCVCRDGDLLLVDAGAEYKYYAGDISRTFPVNGKFSEVQRNIYQGVLDIQKALIKMVKPGMTFHQLNEFSVRELTKLMIEYNLLSGGVEENIQSKAYKKYYPHGVGHYLGIDVHDVGPYEENGEPKKFSPGMVLTIEPGVYVPLDDEDAPEKLRGIGIRIEDDILVTNEGHENLTSLVAKEVSEIEALMLK